MCSRIQPIECDEEIVAMGADKSGSPLNLVTALLVEPLAERRGNSSGFDTLADRFNHAERGELSIPGNYRVVM